MQAYSDLYIRWLRKQLPWTAYDHSAMALALFLSVFVPSALITGYGLELIDKYFY